MHRQITRAKALLAGLPRGFVVLSTDRLNHRHIAPKRPQMRRFRARLGETGGVEDQLGIGFIQPVFHLNKAGGLLETGDCDGQRVDTLRLQASTEFVDKTGVGGLQVRAIEQQRDHRLFRVPVGLPIRQAGRGSLRVINRSARQRPGFGPRIITAQPLTGHAAIQIQCVLQAALTQELPEPVALGGRHSAQVTQLRVRAVITRHQNDLYATRGQLHQALDAVAPVADAAVQGNQNDFGMAQHLIDIQIDRGVILHLHRVGQTQAGVILGQLLRSFGQQRQARIATAENHQLGGRLSQVGDVIVRYKTAGLGSQ